MTPCIFSLKINNIMANLKIRAGLGERFEKTAEIAKERSLKAFRTVEFDFNGVTCIVNYLTDLNKLFRDYSNASIMKWKTVGPECIDEYDEETELKIKEGNEKRERDYKALLEESNKKDELERIAFDEKTKGLSIELSNQKEYNDWKEKNKDGYGAATLEYAEKWAILMQIEMSKGVSLSDCADRTSFELGFLGVTGAMHYMARNVLIQCWKYGKELEQLIK
jgi:hypothetical protein